ncbi:MAG: amidinotransferase [Mucilaginibacter polytrichastri]|nr:amidinotransferase [Mucilaginibacter polytrichastri]
MKQTTSHVLMIRPVRFGYNTQTAGSNRFQHHENTGENVQEIAVREFDRFVDVLQENGVYVTVVEDKPEPHTPDSLFPNNWISFHENGQVFLYPMQAENRRAERRNDIIAKLAPSASVTDLSRYENENRFLEGTGSMVLDRANAMAYACLSPRTDPGLVDLFCRESGFKAILFDAVDADGVPIYHTNVLMGIGGQFAVICLDAIPNHLEKEAVKTALESTGKDIIPISFTQMNAFAGNILQVESNTGEHLLILSQTAFDSLDVHQIQRLGKYSRLLPVSIPVIETIGGGSVRCMLAEIFPA